MTRKKLWLRYAAAAAVVVAGGAGAVVPAGPAYAAGAPGRVWASSGYDSTPAKTATVSCPYGDVFAAGARVAGGDGGVVLTAMVPDPSLTSVTAEAVARAGHAGDWSVIAYAVCAVSTTPPFRVAGTGITVAEASCPAGSHLVGTGFRLDAGADANHLDLLAIGPSLTTVRARAGGPDVPDSLIAYGVCKQPTGQVGDRAWTAGPTDPTWPKLTILHNLEPSFWVYGVGAAVTGPDDAFLTGLVPHPDQDRGYATAARPGQPTPIAAATRVRAQGGEDGDGSVAVYAILIGTFH